MGCGSSKPVHHHHNRRNSSRTNARLVGALQKRRAESAKSAHPMTLERILLKFEKMQKTLREIKDIFESFSDDKKTLNHEQLIRAMDKLSGGSMSVEDVNELFDFVDVEERSVVIDQKEFLVALVIGMVLETIPALCHTQESYAEAAAKRLQEKMKTGVSIRRTVSDFNGHSADVNSMLSLIVDAFLLFDPECKGYIEKSQLDEMMSSTREEKSTNTSAKSTSSHSPEGGKGALSQMRWAEMDFNEDNKLDFVEFVFAFEKWVDIEEVLVD